MSGPRAGVLHATSNLQGEIAFRRGERANNPRKGETRRVQFTLDEGFYVLREKIVCFLNDPPFSTDATTLLEPNVYIKASKDAPQSAYKILDRASFEALIRERWSHITQADVDKLAPGETDTRRVAQLVVAGFQFQFFVYVSVAGATSTSAMRRATASRIVDSTQAVAEFARTQAYLGPITTNHLVVTHARQSAGTPVALPDDNTTRQARALDELVREAEASRASSDNTASIKVEIGRAWIRLRVRISTLRAALGLSPHDIFTRGIFHGFTPVVATPSNADLVDEDHQGQDEATDV